VLYAAGAESEQHLPFAGLHQIVHPIRAGVDVLPPPQRDALRAAMGIADSNVPDVFLVGLAVLTLLSEVASHAPLVVIAEDAHWLDRSSAEVLAFAARRFESEPIVMLAAVRDGALSYLDGAGLASLHVEPLQESAATAVLDGVAPDLDAGLRRRCLDAAAGNPLALTELAQTTKMLNGGGASDSGHLPLTERLERAFTARVAGLPEVTRTVLLSAAVNDSSAVSEVLEASALVMGREVGLADLEPAVTARLIAVSDGDLTFRHPLMRSAIAQSASIGDRSAVHAALGELLHDQPDRRAWHRAAATPGPNEAVASELEAVALRAQRRGGVLNAVATLKQAARLSVDRGLRSERLLKAAELAVESGKQDLMSGLVDELEREDLSVQQRARAVLARSGFDDGIAEDPASLLVLARLAGEVGAEGAVDLALRILWGAARRCFWTEPDEAVRDVIVTTVEGLSVADHDPRVLAVLAYAAPVNRGATVNERLGRIAEQGVDDALANRLLGTAAVLVGAFDLSVRFSAASIAGLRAEGRLVSLTRALAAESWSRVRRGDTAAAIPLVDEARRLAQETGQRVMFAIVRASEAELAALRGEFEQALEFAADAERLALPLGAHPVLATVQTARGLAALGEGKYTDAFEHLRRMHDPADPSFDTALRCYAIADLAEAAARSGEADAGRRILDDLERIGTITPGPALHAGLRYARAVLAVDDEADALFESALGAEQTWPFVRARAELALGERLRRARRSADSRVHLRAARESFDALGIVPWRERARQELRAAGEASPNRGPDARDQLTAHELHIAQLAAEGLTNREIGQRLYLSHRTVSSHLYRIFPKLNVTSRSELAGVIRPTVQA
jgi:DNA-binding CsgD family transcriptional regulator